MSSVLLNLVCFFLQVVDFRCGVREIFAADHLTTELCIKEIESCQRISDGPTFIVCVTSNLILYSLVERNEHLLVCFSKHKYNCVSLLFLLHCFSSQALLGNQYGHRPIPRLIPETEFELLISKLPKDSESLMLLNQWFSKDSNSVPPTYILQPITAHYPHYSDRGSESGQLRDNDVLSWNLTESRLLQALRTAAQQAERHRDISVEQKHKFFKSGKRL